MAEVDRTQLYQQADAFFELGGSAIMTLSREAAEGVCAQAAACGRIVSRIEGGIHDERGFEARLDCIWDSPEPRVWERPRPPIDEADARTNNRLAIDYIESRPASYNAFIITASRYRD